MEKQDVLKAIKELREISKRNFKQTFDIIFNLHHIDIKKNNIDSFLTLKFSPKKVKICAFIEKTLENKAKIFDKVIILEDFPNYKKKEIKDLAREYDLFIAQASLMTKVAATFGKFLGPKGKMPSPKAGCIITPDTNLEPLKDKLTRLIRITTKNEPIIKTIVGNETMSDEEIAENLLLIYNTLLNQLPQKKENIKSTFLKLSMSPAYKFGQGLKKKEPEVKKNGKNSKLEKEKS